MLHDEVVDSGQSSIVPVGAAVRTVEVRDALPVRLQTLDLARHVAITPGGERYVVATFDDRRLGRGYVTAIYPQQDNYLTLVRLVVSEISSSDSEQALQQHVKAIQALQQGRLAQLLKSQSR